MSLRGAARPGAAAASRQPGSISRAEPPRLRRRRSSSYPSSHRTRVLLRRRRQPSPPSARALLAAIADDGVPVAVGLLLIVGGDLEREGLVMFERRPAIEAETGDA